MKRILAFATALVASLCIVSCQGALNLTLNDMTNIKVGQQFSFFTYLEINNDFDETVDIMDNSKWTLVLSEDVESKLEKSGSNFWVFTAPCSGTVQMIYDRDGKNLKTNVASVRVTQ